MKKLHKMTERQTRQQQLGMVTMIGVTLRWEYSGTGEYAKKRWYYKVPDHIAQRRGYINGPFQTKWEAVERAMCFLGLTAPDELPDAAEAALSPGPHRAAISGEFWSRLQRAVVYDIEADYSETEKRIVAAMASKLPPR